RPQLRRSAARARFPAAHREAQGVDAGELEAGRGRDHRRLRDRRRREEDLPAGLEGAQALPADRAAAEVGGTLLSAEAKLERRRPGTDAARRRFGSCAARRGRARLEKLAERGDDRRVALAALETERDGASLALQEPAEDHRIERGARRAVDGRDAITGP